MVLLQLLGQDKNKKKLLSVDKDAHFGQVQNAIAAKLDLDTLEGLVVSQIDERDDGNPVSYIYADTKLSTLPKLGSGYYLWVREPDDDTPREAIVGADGSGPVPEDEPTPTPQDTTQPPHEEETPVHDEENAEEQIEEQAPPEPEPEAAPPPKKLSPPRPPPKQQESSPVDATQDFSNQEDEEEMLETGMMMHGALSTEAYEVNVGKYRQMSTAVAAKSYPIKYANVRRNAPRVTTLSVDASDTKAPACLRESYNWTGVGRYKAMTDTSGKVGKSKTGAFKSPEEYPRFAPTSAEAQLKKLFAEQMRAREKSKVMNETAKDRNQKTRKAIEDALQPPPK